MDNLTVDHIDQRLKEYKITIDRTVFELAKELAPQDPYHNFGHELQVANTVIDLWEIQNKNKTKKDLQGLKLLVIAAIFHDAWYRMDEKKTKLWELKTCDILQEFLKDQTLQELGIKRKQLNSLILNTKLESHKTTVDELSQILQDADFGCFWYGPEYLLYTVMNLIDEGEITLDHFIDNERNFLIKFLNRKVFVSKAGQAFFDNPFASIKTIESRWQDVINEAYRLREEKLTYSEFVEKLHAFIKSKWRKVRSPLEVP